MPFQDQNFNLKIEDFSSKYMYGSAYRNTCQINEIGLCIKYGMLGKKRNKLT
jgi:hypothetical protein